jgi:DNA-binding CsgD family transcriptional regulator
MRLAADALDRLAGWTRAGGYEFGLGIEARARALLSEGEAAEGHYREAIGRLGRTPGRPELARAHLLYGEWLRRERRRGEAREQLRTACQLLDAIGMEGFAARARRELAAAGETTRPPVGRPARTLPGPGSEPLTAQEAQVARLARDGLSNPEIGARLFISARTVQYHLSKVFTKLGISSRAQLDRALRDSPAGTTARSVKRSLFRTTGGTCRRHLKGTASPAGRSPGRRPARDGAGCGS